jgi:hypothetical protein
LDAILDIEAEATAAAQQTAGTLDVERLAEVVSDALAATTMGTELAEAPEPSDEPGSPYVMRLTHEIAARLDPIPAPHPRSEVKVSESPAGAVLRAAQATEPAKAGTDAARALVEAVLPRGWRYTTRAASERAVEIGNPAWQAQAWYGDNKVVNAWGDSEGLALLALADKLRAAR